MRTTRWAWMHQLLGVAGLMAVLSPAWLQAGNAAWSATAASGDWSDGANWIGGTAPGANDGSTTSPDVAVFSNASSTRIVLPDASRNIAGFLFTNAACGTYTNGASDGNKLLLSSGGSIYLAANLGSNQVVNAPLELEGDGGTYTITNASAKSLTLGGAINGVASTGNTNTLLLTGSAGGTISGVISDGGNGGSLALAKWGAGAWTLSASNAHSGGTTLNVGTLSINNSCALGRGTFTINGGTVGTDVARTLSNVAAHVWNGSFSTTYNMPKMNLSTSPVTLGSNVTISLPIAQYNGSTLIVGGVISDGGNGRSLTVCTPSVNYSGTLMLTGTNTFSGGFTLSNGTLNVNNNYAFGTGPIRFVGGSVLPANGMVIADTNIIYLTSLALASYGVSLDLGQGPMTLATNATVNLGRNPAYFRRPITDGGNNFRLTVTSYDSYQSESLYLYGTNTFGGGVDILPMGGNGYNGNYVTLNIGYLGTDTTASAIGTGTLRILPSTYANLQLLAGIDNASGTDGTLATSNPQVWSNSFKFVGTKSLNMGAGAVTMGTNVTIIVNANVLTIGGAIRDSNRGFSLSKAGAGELVLGGANTYTGLTTVSAGRLTANSTGTLGGGNVYVWTNGVLALQNGNAIARTATLTLATNWPSCYVVLSNSTPNVIAKLIVGTNTYTQPGTYGSTNSTAQFKIATSLTGTGLLKIPVPAGTAIFFR